KPTDFKADEILFHAYSPGGASLADSASYPTAAWSARIVNESGVGGLTRIELGKLLAGRLADAYPYVEDYSHGISGSCRPEDLDTALDLATLAFTQPTRDSSAFVTLKRRMRSVLMERANSPEA